jgi:catechol 2,3-dioxygenase-like lactoylglutathione lyase family enzyme
MANTFHVSLYVKSVPEAVERYRKILGAEPAKLREDYAKFELADPPLILSLNLGGTPGTVGHLGIRYPESSRVAAELKRAEGDALEPFSEAGVTCCYAKADKFWVRDADGIPWELYALLADAEPEPAPARRLAPSSVCGCAS